MPVYQQLINFDDKFHRLSEIPIIINDLVNNTEEDKEEIKNLISTRYSSDMISLIPSCRCGATTGEFSMMTDMTCTLCYTSVKSSFDEDIDSTIWFRKPKGVERIINPIIWIMLKQRFSKSGFNVIQWICDNSYRSNVKQPFVINRIISLGIKRGYNNFVTNFDAILLTLFEMKEFNLPKGKVDYLRTLLEENKDCLFSDYIPLPNKSLLIIENTVVGVYVDPIVIDALDAIQMLVSIDVSFHDQNSRVKENRTVKAISKLSAFYESFYKNSLAVKPGQFRKHIYGTRTNFSFRAVISSITDVHEYDELYIPWGVGLTAFRPHLVNKLMKLGMSVNSAVGMLLGHVTVYHPLLASLLQELIDESNGGIDAIIQRNPSLMQGSAQKVRITKFKDDPFDFCISLGILIIHSCNADFDGDCMNVSLALDEKMSNYLHSLKPEFNIFQLDVPDKISKNIALPKPNVCSHSAWLEIE
jgi:hypothetical protein